MRCDLPFSFQLFIASFVVDTFRYFGRNVHVLWTQADISLGEF